MKDTVVIMPDEDEVRSTPARLRPLEESFQAVPALEPRRTLEEMTEIAPEEHAQEVAREGSDE